MAPKGSSPLPVARKHVGRKSQIPATGNKVTLCDMHGSPDTMDCMSYESISLRLIKHVLLLYVFLEPRGSVNPPDLCVYGCMVLVDVHPLNCCDLHACEKFRATQN